VHFTCQKLQKGSSFKFRDLEKILLKSLRPLCKPLQHVQNKSCNPKLLAPIVLTGLEEAPKA